MGYTEFMSLGGLEPYEYVDELRKHLMRRIYSQRRTPRTLARNI